MPYLGEIYSLPRGSLFSILDLTQRKADFAWGMCDRRLLIAKISCEMRYNHLAELYVLHLPLFCR